MQTNSKNTQIYTTRMHYGRPRFSPRGTSGVGADISVNTGTKGLVNVCTDGNGSSNLRLNGI